MQTEQGLYVQNSNQSDPYIMPYVKFMNKKELYHFLTKNLKIS